MLCEPLWDNEMLVWSASCRQATSSVRLRPEAEAWWCFALGWTTSRSTVSRRKASRLSGGGRAEGSCAMGKGEAARWQELGLGHSRCDLGSPREHGADDDAEHAEEDAVGALEVGRGRARVERGRRGEREDGISGGRALPRVREDRVGEEEVEEQVE